jgi:hypothetical protein
MFNSFKLTKIILSTFNLKGKHYDSHSLAGNQLIKRLSGNKIQMETELEDKKRAVKIKRKKMNSTSTSQSFQGSALVLFSNIWDIQPYY